jgi:hypothetical protein
MSNLAKKRLFLAISVFLVLAVIYCALAILQAASLFTGERALRNLYFWGSLMCVAFVGAVVFGVLAHRVGRLMGSGGSRAA